MRRWCESHPVTSEPLPGELLGVGGCGANGKDVACSGLGAARGCTRPLISHNAISAVFAVMLIICGVLVNGPYALITTAVSADLVSEPHVGTRLG